MLVVNSLVPVLRVNNRTVNQAFFEENLGFKSLLEEGAFLDLSDRESSQVKLVLVESPSMRTRAVLGKKKLGKILIKAEHPREIEHLLATGSRYTALFKGERGYAFEAVSPEGDVFLLHAEESLDNLHVLTSSPDFKPLEGARGLSRFQVEQVVIRTPDVEKSQRFYQSLLSSTSLLHFEKGEGEDLLADSDSTWDLESLRFHVSDEEAFSDLEESLAVPYFKDKKGRFIQTFDPSKIELWFER